MQNNKIPVGATIAHAYRFAFGEFLNLLRLIWLPLVVNELCALLLATGIPALRQAIASHDFSSLTLPWPVILLLYVVALVAHIMQLTAALQYALGRIEARGRWFYVTFGRPLWRMIGAIFLLVLIMAVLTVVYFLGSLLFVFLVRLGLRLSHVSDTAIAAIGLTETVLIVLIGVCAFLFCLMRFGFLLETATIAQDHIGLAESWTLSHRNFWRMVVVSLAVFLPFMMVESAWLWANGFYHFPPPGTPPDQVRAVMNAKIALIQARSLHFWYAYYPALIALTTLFCGLTAGAGSFAWRWLTAGTEPGEIAQP